MLVCKMRVKFETFTGGKIKLKITITDFNSHIKINPVTGI